MCTVGDQIGVFWYTYGMFVMIMTNYIRWCGPKGVNICGYRNVYVDKEFIVQIIILLFDNFSKYTNNTF